MNNNTTAPTYTLRGLQLIGWRDMQHALDYLFADGQLKQGTLVAAQVNVAGMGQLRQLADSWRAKQLSDVLVLATGSEGKANMLVAVSDDKTKDIKAGDVIKAIAPAINGGGGGRPNLAQAGGKNPAGIPTALKQAAEYLNK